MWSLPTWSQSDPWNISVYALFQYLHSCFHPICCGRGCTYRFMLKCNLTVSTGTLNGLIFYANIIRANQAVYFPVEKSERFSSLLSVFIAWLNLDLGVEVCLFQGMDAYIRTWLQFVFPVYIWILVGFIMFK